MARDADFSLTPEERRVRDRKRWRVWIIIVAAVIGLALAAVAARPTRNAIKGWQARRQAEKAFALIEQEKWKEAQQAAVAAYQLRATEPEALRALARFFSRVRQPQALEFWDKLKQRQSLTPADLRDEAAIALTVNDQPRAETAIKTLTSGNAVTAADWLLAAQLGLQKGAAPEAAEALQKVFSDTEADERTQLQASLLVLGSSARSSAGDADAEAQMGDAWARVERVARSDTQAGLDALVVLARRQLSSPGVKSQEAEVSGQESESAIRNPKSEMAALSEAVQSHPLAKAPQKLLALDLRMQADASQREALIRQGVEQWRNSDASSLATLAAWLNGKGAFQLNLDTIPQETALQSQELFLQHVDALGALGRWDDIRQLLEAERFPLDPVIQQMYLARCNLQLGNRVAAENSWQRALEAAAGDVRKLMMLAEYAEKNGARETATGAYAQATSVAPKLRPAWAGRLRAAQAAKDTRQMQEVLAGMLELWPDDAAIQNDEAYTRLLLLPNDPAHPELVQIAELAGRLVAASPASLPHRTLLALARLKQGRPADALQVYDGIQAAASALTPSAVAIHAAVLHANGHSDDARAETAQVPSEALLPEERSAAGDLRD